MRSLRFSATAALGLSAAGLLAGCNAIFGLDPVTQRDPVDGGSSGSGGGSGGNGGSGGSGGGKACPGGAVAGNLIANPSFEKNSAWSTAGEGAMFGSLPADECSFACGSRVGHLSVPAGGDPGSVSVFQDVSTTIELGGTLTLDARYRYTATNSPYFSLTANGYDIGVPYIHGVQDGEHLAITKFEVPVLDPRRTGEGLRAGLFADYDAAGLDATVDCVALTYTPPPGAQVLLNGWFAGSVSAWGADNAASVKWDASGGLCSSGVAHVTVPANAGNAEIRSTVYASWPKDTVFHFGAAVQPLPDGNGNLSILTFSLSLFVEYEDDGNPGTSDIVNFAVAAESDSQAWKRLAGEFKATQAVKAIGLWIGGGSSSSPGEFLADCASVRAVTP